jgi:hypothetical protein
MTETKPEVTIMVIPPEDPEAVRERDAVPLEGPARRPFGYHSLQNRPPREDGGLYEGEYDE